MVGRRWRWFLAEVSVLFRCQIGCPIIFWVNKGIVSNVWYLWLCNKSNWFESPEPKQEIIDWLPVPGIETIDDGLYRDDLFRFFHSSIFEITFVYGFSRSSRIFLLWSESSFSQFSEVKNFYFVKNYVWPQSCRKEF